MLLSYTYDWYHVLAKPNINKILDLSFFFQNNQVYNDVGEHYYKLLVFKFKNTCWPPCSPRYPGCDLQFERKKVIFSSLSTKSLSPIYCDAKTRPLTPLLPHGAYVKGLGFHLDWKMHQLSSRDLWKTHCLIFEMNLFFHTLMAP